MSEAAAEKAEKAPAAAGGGNKKILIIVMAVNVLLAGGLGYVVISGRSHAADQAKAGAKAAKHGAEGEEAEGEGEGHEAKEEPEEEEEEEEDKKGKHGSGGKFGPLVEVGTFIANLAGPQSRYAKVTLHVEALNEEAKARVEGAIVPIKAEALMLISNAKPEDVIGQEKLIAMSEEILKRANKLLGKRSIKRVYISELVVQ